MPQRTKRILVCVLDWGLGHATRTIPIVYELLRQGAEVRLASAGAPLHLLRSEFPALESMELPPYRPVYPRRASMMWKMFSQAPRFGAVARAEHRIIEGLVQQHGIDVVISDNRFGCWSSGATSVFITHQTNVLMPRGWSWMRPLARTIIQGYAGKFNRVWIPDVPGSGLTDAFVHTWGQHHTYIGWLSRFGMVPDTGKQYDVLALVSGPEPQRAIFEKILIKELAGSGLKSLLVAGEPGKPYQRQEGCLKIINHLPSVELETAIRGAELVISRSGYSTVMDLIALGKKAIFVPTPQQPEQIFIAQYLKENKIALAMSQSEFSLKTAMDQSTGYRGLSVYKQEGGRLNREITALLS